GIETIARVEIVDDALELARRKIGRVAQMKGGGAAREVRELLGHRATDSSIALRRAALERVQCLGDGGAGSAKERERVDEERALRLRREELVRDRHGAIAIEGSEHARCG